jgi:hypothetical protein
MIAVEGTTIHLTRGDSTHKNYNNLAFEYPIYNLATKQEEKYIFQLDDKISFVVMSKKGYTKEEIFRKEYTLRDIGYKQPSEVVELPLDEEETKLFPLSNKAQTYWYDLILNDNTTMLGFDNEGGKRLVVYPEVEEV